MTTRRSLSLLVTRLARSDAVNYRVTNYMPRRLASRWVGRISRSENRLVRMVALWMWRCFAELDLSDAEATEFRSMQDCFTRRLRAGARPIDPDPAILTSPCDAIIGAFGTIAGDQAMQVKGMTYLLTDLLGDKQHAASLEGGSFMTLRLTSAMYHRFHAPYDCRVQQVRHIFGDRWNVNPPTLRRVRRLFCRNERVIIRTVLSPGGEPVTLVAVAAILVSGIRLGFLQLKPGRPPLRHVYPCDVVFPKGAELGWFEHGSTIIVLAPAELAPAELAPAELAPPELAVAALVREGDSIRMGQPLLKLTSHRI